MEYLFIYIGIGLLLGLLIGTILYIIGGYFLPFLVYGSVMLLVTPFAARLIPSRPLDDSAAAKYWEKSSDEETDFGDDTKDYSNNDISLEEGNTVKPTVNKRKRINPFKLIWALLCNKVSFSLLLSKIGCLNQVRFLLFEKTVYVINELQQINW